MIKDKKPNNLRIFLIEDSLLFRDLLTDRIKELKGVELVGHTDSVMGTMKKIKNVAPDLVILDLKLLDGNGIELIPRLRQLQHNVIIAILSMYETFKKRSISVGADYYFDKSSEFDECINLIMYTAYKKQLN
jgi:DNA-binding NarL/FixJ family response regulator